jgi:hypothetical protein
LAKLLLLQHGSTLLAQLVNAHKGIVSTKTTLFTSSLLLCCSAVIQLLLLLLLTVGSPLHSQDCYELYAANMRDSGGHLIHATCIHQDRRHSALAGPLRANIAVLASIGPFTYTLVKYLCVKEAITDCNTGAAIFAPVTVAALPSRSV